MLTIDEVASYREIKQDSSTIHVLQTLDNIKARPTQENWDGYWSNFSIPQPPTYLRRTTTFRWEGRYVEADPETEVKFAEELNNRIFTKYLDGLDAIAEFGCGSGKNLVQLSKMFPSMRRYAFDWSPAAVKLNSVHATTGVFDMTNPRALPELNDEKNLAILTSGALEQVGCNYKNFLSTLQSLKAKIYIHIEPIIELYNNDKLFDYLAIQYHKRRDYLGTFMTDVAKDNTVVYHKRTGFGNIYNEGYSVLIWELK